MKIAVEARYLLVKDRTGVENYTYFLLEALARLAGDHQLELYLHRPPRTEERELLQPFLGSPVAHFHVVPPLKLWLKLWLPLVAQLQRADVGLFPGSILPLYLPFPSVMVVYDLCWSVFPECYPQREIKIFRDIYPRSLQAAKVVFAISEFTKGDIQRVYGTPADKIHLVPCGLDPLIAPVPDAADRVRAQWGLEPGYVLAVGTSHPRKNIATLLRAYALAKPPQPLVLLGPPGDTTNPLAQLAEQLEIADRVRWLGYVAREELSLIYSAAGTFVMPSLYEGFGMPVLEAMACGTPVICSNTTALPEVTGEAALHADPQQPEAFAGALARIYAEKGLAGELRERGLARAKLYNWDHSAQLALQYLHELA